TIDLGPDTSICAGNSKTITTGLTDPTFNHSWTLNGNLLSETSNTLTVSQSGTYAVRVTKNNSSCVITDEIIFSDLTVTNPTNIVACNNGSTNYNYNLTQNNETTLAIDDAIYDVFYYTSFANATAHTNPVPQAQVNNYTSAGNQTIYLALFNRNSATFCNAVYQFDLLVSSPITVNTINNIINCDDPNGYSINLDNHTLTNNPQLASNFNLYFYPSQAEAQNGGTGNYTNSTNYAVSTGASTQTIWVRIESTTNAQCFRVVSFSITINALPPVDSLSNVIECSSYILPTISMVIIFQAQMEQEQCIMLEM
ncbi:MAG: hypothetical protein HC854_17450, partial [Flavobacterium sp.]|nr:hypothetical protein [Flavobacterium sp.]